MTRDIIDFRTRKLVFLDIETTGFDPLIHEIIEIGCFVVDGGTFDVLSRYERKIKPEHIERASPLALEINGYTEEGWRESKSLKEVMREFKDIAPGGMIIGWNVSFDWSFLENAFRRLNITPQFDYHRIDVMSIGYSLLYDNGDVRELGLRKVAPKLSIETKEGLHRATDDAFLAYQVFKKLMRRGS